MTNDENLHQAKCSDLFINDLFIKYQDIRHEYLSGFPIEEDKVREVTRYEARERSFLDFRNQVREWITLAEHRLSDHLDESSEVKGSRLQVCTPSRPQLQCFLEPKKELKWQNYWQKKQHSSVNKHLMLLQNI